MVIGDPYERSGSPDEISDVDAMRKKIRYLYLCKKCGRSFDSGSKLEKCKFCEWGDIKELHNRIPDKNYNYICSGCNTGFKEPPMTTCPECAQEIVSRQEWIAKKRTRKTEFLKNSIYDLYRRTKDSYYKNMSRFKK